jgi:hypothetical protein
MPVMLSARAITNVMRSLSDMFSPADPCFGNCAQLSVICSPQERVRAGLEQFVLLGRFKSRNPRAGDCPMTAPHETWTVLPHGILTAIDDNILTVTGTVKMPVGTFERRMTVVQLSGGGSVIYSPIALDEPQMQRLEAFGAPAFLVIPGRHHRVDAKIWKDRYPAAQVVSAEGAREAVEEIVPVESTAPAFPDSGVRFFTVAGTSEDEAALTVVGNGTTLILNDILANVQNAKGLNGVIAHLFGFAGKKPQIPLPEKLSILNDRKALATQFRSWADDPSLKRIVVSHGEIIDTDPAGVLRDVAATLN